MNRRCRLCSKKSVYGCNRVFELSARNHFVDGYNGTTAYGIGYDVCIGGGFLFAASVRFASYKTA